MSHFEAEVCSWFDRVITTSDRERRLLMRLSRSVPEQGNGNASRVEAQDKTIGAKFAAIPNGVDCEYFRPATGAGRGCRIVFWGRLGYYANVDAVEYFVQQVLPIVRQRVPDAQFVVVGRDPHKTVRKMARRGQIELRASVPDIRPFLWEAAVAVAPMRIAVGVQNKVLEAMASGVPVVCTSSARQSIDAEDGAHLLVGANAAEFADHVTRLLVDRELAAHMATAARQRVESAHSWEAAAARLEAVYEEAIRERHARRDLCAD
ncbi:MAG: glycosyltransferase [Armatimonadota bacterium]